MNTLTKKARKEYHTVARVCNYMNLNKRCSKLKTSIISKFSSSLFRLDVSQQTVSCIYICLGTYKSLCLQRQSSTLQCSNVVITIFLYYIYQLYVAIYILYTYLLWSPFKLIPLEFALTILIAERIERCTVEKVFKEKR